MRTHFAFALFACLAPALAQAGQLKTADEVLNRYKQALGGADAIAKVQSQTVHGEIESSASHTKSTFVYYARPFKNLFKVQQPDGSESISGFDGKISWSVTAQGANIDKDTPVESARRDADLQYALHQPDYFSKLEFAGIADFEGHHCYWLHGITHWGRDNNQYYDVDTGLLVGYRFQADDSSKVLATATFDDYKNFGGPLVATKHTFRVREQSQTLIFKTVSYDPIGESMFELPAAVKALAK